MKNLYSGGILILLLFLKCSLSGGLYSKTFYGRNLKDFRNKLARVFVSGKPFHPSLMFMGKVGAYPNKAPFSCSTLG